MVARHECLVSPALQIEPEFRYIEIVVCQMLRRWHGPNRDFKGLVRTSETGPNSRMRTLFLVIGVIALLVGLVWTGQGAGLIQWPAQSFMINQSQWMWYGASTAFGGLLLIFISRKV